VPFYIFLWDDATIEHLALHGVSPEEFEEVVSSPERFDESRSSGRPIVFGWVEGRHLACVYELIDESTVLPVTAYEVED